MSVSERGSLAGVPPSKEDAGDEDRSLLFRPVQARRVPEEIVEQVRAQLRKGALKPGDRLPTERHLAATFAVSRVSVRDALRSLEASGLIETRVGARGGSFVVEPDDRQLSEHLRDLVALGGFSDDNLLEARLALERAILELACERATRFDVAALREICERAERSRHGEEAGDLEFHRRLASCAHNPAVELTLGSLLDVLVRSSSRRAGSPAARLQEHREHRLLIEAIETKDAPLAWRLIGEHLDRQKAVVRSLATARRPAGRRGFAATIEPARRARRG